MRFHARLACAPKRDGALQKFSICRANQRDFRVRKRHAHQRVRAMGIDFFDVDTNGSA
jgi:hypothetical protein